MKRAKIKMDITKPLDLNRKQKQYLKNYCNVELT